LISSFLLVAGPLQIGPSCIPSPVSAPATPFYASSANGAAGTSADFIILNANPLENIANTRRINKVYLRGQEVVRAALRAKWQAEWSRKTK